jgi:hypothetical protein
MSTNPLLNEAHAEMPNADPLAVEPILPAVALQTAALGWRVVTNILSCGHSGFVIHHPRWRAPVDRSADRP